MTTKKTLKLSLVRGVGGFTVYLNDHRIAGLKPWAGGKVEKEWDVDLADIKTALKGPAK